MEGGNENPFKDANPKETFLLLILFPLSMRQRKLPEIQCGMMILTSKRSTAIGSKKIRNTYPP